MQRMCAGTWISEWQDHKNETHPPRRVPVNCSFVESIPRHPRSLDCSYCRHVFWIIEKVMHAYAIHARELKSLLYISRYTQHSYLSRQTYGVNWTPQDCERKFIFALLPSPVTRYLLPTRACSVIYRAVSQSMSCAV